jgi:3-deoxy-manno-octulosonate cytidylyltransferase (CMP-KDO synthetase)
VALIVIPARMGATRLPGKPLLSETGKPLVVHTLEQVRHCTKAARVVVATDDERIAAAVRAAWGEAVMTSPGCRSGTDRVAEAARSIAGEDVIVNVQADEPEVEPAAVDALIAALEGDLTIRMATLAAPLLSDEELHSPSVVKVVADAKGDALYFSRAPIPFARDPLGPARPRRHVGVYAYRREFLLKIAATPPHPLEEIEKLEQLRVLGTGGTIRVGLVAHAHRGVDTPADYAEFVRAYRDGGTRRAA